MALFLSYNSFKGVKKAQQKCNFIAEVVVTNDSKSNDAKTKNTLLYTIFDPNKNIIIIILFL